MMKMPWEDDINWGNTATTIVKGEPNDMQCCINYYRSVRTLSNYPLQTYCMRFQKIVNEADICDEYYNPIEDERRADERKKITIECNICPKPEYGDEFPIPKEGWEGVSDEHID